MLGKVIKDLFSKSAPQNTEQVTQTHIRLEKGNWLVKSRHGWYIANENDIYLGMSFVLYGECVEIEQCFLSSLVSNGDIIIEVGANIGALTIPLAKKVGVTGRVIAIEPQPPVFLTLSANIALNSLTNVRPHAIGCGATRSTMYLPQTDYTTETAHNSGGVSLSLEKTEELGMPVSVIPLDELCAELDRLKLIKIDAEGMEEEILNGGYKLIKKYRPILFVENDRAEKSESLIKWLQAADYRLWWEISPLFNNNNYFKNNENKYKKISSFNMVCFPSENCSSITDELPEIIDATIHPFINPSR